MLRTISRDELQAKIERGDDFVLLETLAPESYERSHIPGALNLPPDRVEEVAPALIPDKTSEVVVYCASLTCNASPEVAAKLQELGYRNVIDYPGGKADWKEAGLELDSGALIDR